MDANTSAFAAQYLHSMLPAFIVLGLLDIDRNYLACFSRSDIAMYAQLTSPFAHVVFCYILISSLNLGVVGCGLAMLCTNLLVLNLQSYMMH